MSTAPQGWQNPKTNWQAADIVHPSDFNRIEGNIQAIENGSRTLDPSQAPSGNMGSLRQLLDWFANRIRAITGMANWWQAPPTTLTAAKSHIDAAAPHSGHETPTGAQAKVDAHANLTAAHSATSTATANRIIIRDSAGRAKVAAPSASDDIARKAEVDAVSSALNTHKDATSGIHGATSSATANRLVIRDGSGRAKFAVPSASGDAATKGYVDALLGIPMAAGTNFVVQVIGPSDDFQDRVSTYPNWQASIRNTSDTRNNVAVRILLPGTVRCALSHRTPDTRYDSYARVLKNGSTVQEWSTVSEAFVDRSVDVDVSPGDVITFQQRLSTLSGTYGSIWSNLRVMTAAPTLGIQRIL